MFLKYMLNKSHPQTFVFKESFATDSGVWVLRADELVTFGGGHADDLFCEDAEVVTGRATPGD